MGDDKKKTPSLEDDLPFPLTDMDKWVLSQTDDEFHLHDWEELKEIIANNKLESLKRKPSDLRRYMSWTQETKAQYGSMTNYLLQQRLPWGSPPFIYTSPIPFTSPSDFKILTNDWPYGLKDGITHLVVWSKTPIPVDEDTGDVTEESRRIIGEFVRRTFGDEDRAVWFKNWVALQSVRALEHVHVMVKDARKADVEAWTGELSR
ncbi:hypothetical protein JHW43_001323 [Diplocarpon mali]|nr:hypothetical protein JHW43_001323 [Diplocarpon mali]